MTTKTPEAALSVAVFPDFAPRNDMMNPEHIHDYGNQPALRLHLGDPESTIVLGEVPIYQEVPHSREGRAGVRVPDLLVAFHIRRAQVIAQKGYAISEQGKPPDFVLEVASDSTARTDETDKREDYARFGVTEYWLFDPDWGRRYRRGLMGWRLVNGRYVPIYIWEYASGRYCGWSAALGLYVCWEEGRLRWYDPVSGYLRTHDEEQRGRISAETGRITAEAGRIIAEAQRDAVAAERDAERDERITAEAGRIAAEVERDAERDERINAEAQRDSERDERMAAEAERDSERDERMAAEAERDSERDERIAAEAEVARLRAEIARLRGDAADEA